MPGAGAAPGELLPDRRAGPPLGAGRRPLTSRKPKAPPALTQDEREILEVRRDRLRHKPQAAADEEAIFWVAEFPVGDDRYAVPLHRLRGSVPLRLVTPVPLSPPHVVGILRFQGQVIAALSLAVLLGGRGWRQDPAVLLVVEGPSGELLALDCEQVPQPLSVPLRAVEEARGRNDAAVSAVGLPGARQVNLIDLDRLLARVSGGLGG